MQTLINTADIDLQELADDEQCISAAMHASIQPSYSSSGTYTGTAHQTVHRWRIIQSLWVLIRTGHLRGVFFFVLFFFTVLHQR